MNDAAGSNSVVAHASDMLVGAGLRTSPDFVAGESGGLGNAANPKAVDFLSGTASCVECQSLIVGGYDPAGHSLSCSEYDDTPDDEDEAYWAASPPFGGGA